MEIGTIIVALILIFIAWKVLAGMVKIVAIVALIAGAIWLFSSGALAA